MLPFYSIVLIIFDQVIAHCSSISHHLSIFILYWLLSIIWLHKVACLMLFVGRLIKIGLLLGRGRWPLIISILLNWRVVVACRIIRIVCWLVENKSRVLAVVLRLHLLDVWPLETTSKLLLFPYGILQRRYFHLQLLLLHKQLWVVILQGQFWLTYGAIFSHSFHLFYALVGRKARTYWHGSSCEK